MVKLAADVHVCVSVGSVNTEWDRRLINIYCYTLKLKVKVEVNCFSKVFSEGVQLFIVLQV